MSNTTLWILGSILIAAGLGIAAWAGGIPPIWIAAGALVVLGIGVHGAVRNTRRKETPPPDKQVSDTTSRPA